MLLSTILKRILLLLQCNRYNTHFSVLSSLSSCPFCLASGRGKRRRGACRRHVAIRVVFISSMNSAVRGRPQALSFAAPSFALFFSFQAKHYILLLLMQGNCIFFILMTKYKFACKHLCSLCKDVVWRSNRSTSPPLFNVKNRILRWYLYLSCAGSGVQSYEIRSLYSFDNWHALKQISNVLLHYNYKWNFWFFYIISNSLVDS